MRAPIARIKISAGNPGWYDPLTNIHLTITRPDAIVYEGSNLSNIKVGVSHKLIYVVEGELEPKQVSIPVEEVKEVREVIEEPAKEKVEDVVEEQPIKEEVEVIEEVKEEKKTAKKTSTRKKATKKTEETTK